MSSRGGSDARQSGDRKNLAPAQAETQARKDAAAKAVDAKNLQRSIGKDPESPVPGSQAWADKQGLT